MAFPLLSLAFPECRALFLVSTGPREARQFQLDFARENRQAKRTTNGHRRATVVSEIVGLQYDPNIFQETTNPFANTDYIGMAQK